MSILREGHTNLRVLNRFINFVVHLLIIIIIIIIIMYYYFWGLFIIIIYNFYLFNSTSING